MERAEAINLLKEKVKSKNLIKHCLAVEAVMRGLAERFNENQEKWGLAGLLHDIDYEETKNDPARHSLLGAEMLGRYNLDQEIIEAIKAHNEIHNLPRQSQIAKALFCSDPTTGLIVASTLVFPSKMIKDLTVENVLNRYKEKSFARGANRITIATCQELSLSLLEFLQIALKAMQNIAGDLGL